MIQGWRPTSVTTHPASMATNPSGEATTKARNSHRPGNVPVKRCRLRQAAIQYQATRPTTLKPMPTMIWKATWTMRGSGWSSRGHSSSPRTTAFGSW
jgi:hypothetical protein